MSTKIITNEVRCVIGVGWVQAVLYATFVSYGIVAVMNPAVSLWFLMPTLTGIVLVWCAAAYEKALVAMINQRLAERRAEEALYDEVMKAFEESMQEPDSIEETKKDD